MARRLGRTGWPTGSADYERGVIASALMAHRGNLKPVYESLGLSRKSLYEKMQKYGLDKRGYLEESDTQ